MHNVFDRVCANGGQRRSVNTLEAWSVVEDDARCVVFDRSAHALDTVPGTSHISLWGGAFSGRQALSDQAVSRQSESRLYEHRFRKAANSRLLTGTRKLVPHHGLGG